MTEPLRRPPRKNPQRRTRIPVLPDSARSRAALGLAAAAAEGRFALQKCSECGTVQYPPRDACSRCLSHGLAWTDISPEGVLLAQTTVRVSTNVYFRERAPWRVGTVKLQAGPSIMCHVHGDVKANGPVVMSLRLDRSGQGVFFALPPEGTENMEDDPQFRQTGCDPKFRRILITDGRNENSVALAHAFAQAQAAMIFVGESESWRPNRNRAELDKIGKVSIMPLDVTDTKSVRELVGEIGGKVDILVNNSRFFRPGGLFERLDTMFAAQEMDTNVLGLMRLAQAFGPAMRARGADGDNSATAWVNLLSVYALSNLPEMASFSASHAAALSLSQALRSEFHAGGVRVLNVFCGPTDDEWHQPLPPPKVSPQQLAASVIRGLREGLEDVYSGDVARDIAERWKSGPKILERELTHMRNS